MVGKKARFLAVAATAVHDALVVVAAAVPRSEIAAMGGAEAVSVIPVIEAVAERAEDLAEDPDHRGAWDVVTARAVGSLAEVLELAMPLTREGGWVVAWKREEEQGGLRAELRDAGSIIRATGGGRPEIVVVPAPSLAGHRLVIVPKERPTPASYPRPAGVRRRRERRAQGILLRLTGRQHRSCASRPSCWQPRSMLPTTGFGRAYAHAPVLRRSGALLGSA